MDSVVHKKDFSIKGAFVFGFRNLWSHILYFLGISVLYAFFGFMAVTIILFIPFAGNLGDNMRSMQAMKVTPKDERIVFITTWMSDHVGLVILVFILLFTISFFIGRYYVLGLTNVSLHIYDRKPISMSTFFSTYRLLLKDIGAAFLYWLLVVLGIMLLIVPGIYFMLAFGLFHQFIVDKNAWPIEALKKSFALTKGVKWKLLGVSLAYCGLTLIINILALIPGVGFLMIFMPPLAALVYTYVYRTLLNFNEPRYEQGFGQNL